MRENAFQNILDDNTAYWLGFLTADGSISKTTIQNWQKIRRQR